MEYVKYVEQYSYPTEQELKERYPPGCKGSNDEWKCMMVIKKTDGTSVHEWIFKDEFCTIGHKIRNKCPIYIREDDQKDDLSLYLKNVVENNWTATIVEGFAGDQAGWDATTLVRIPYNFKIAKNLHPHDVNIHYFIGRYDGPLATNERGLGSAEDAGGAKVTQ